MSMEIIAIQNVHGYVDSNGTAWLNAKDVAIGLGFVHIENKNGKEYISVRYERINQYLREFGFAQTVGEGSFIPENMFYRLAMKARNETAERFQAKVADEILPQIRKTGSYSLKPKEITSDLLFQIAEQLRIKEQQLANAEREAKKNQDARMLQEIATNNDRWYSLKVAAKALNIDGMGRNNLFRFLRNEGILDSENCPYQQHVTARRFSTQFNETFDYWLTKISPNGMRYVLQKLGEAGYGYRVSLEEWQRNCELIMSQSVEED